MYNEDLNLLRAQLLIEAADLLDSENEQDSIKQYCDSIQDTVNDLKEKYRGNAFSNSSVLINLSNNCKSILSSRTIPGFAIDTILSLFMFIAVSSYSRDDSTKSTLNSSMLDIKNSIDERIEKEDNIEKKAELRMLNTCLANTLDYIK